MDVEIEIGVVAAFAVFVLIHVLVMMRAARRHRRRAWQVYYDHATFERRSAGGPNGSSRSKG